MKGKHETEQQHHDRCKYAGQRNRRSHPERYQENVDAVERNMGRKRRMADARKAASA